MARKLALRGITVVASNHDTPLIRQLYTGAEIQTIEVQRSISCKGNARAPVREVIAVLRPSGYARVSCLRRKTPQSVRTRQTLSARKP